MIPEFEYMKEFAIYKAWNNYSNVLKSHAKYLKKIKM